MNNIKINIRYFAYLCVILSLFSSLNIYLFKYAVNISNVLLLSLCGLLLVIQPKKILGKLVNICKNVPIKYFVIYLTYSIIITPILIFTIGISIPKFIFFLLAFIVQIFLPIIIFAYIIKRYISYSIILKLVVGTFYIILLIGVSDFIVNFLNIKFLHDLLFIFHTRWINTGEFGYKAMVGAFPRMQSVFDEPSHLGWSILLCSPLIYSIKIYGVKIFKNIYIEKLISDTIIPLMWLDLLLTFSPIMIIFTVAVNGLFYLKEIYQSIKIKKVALFIITIIFTFFLVIVMQDSSIDIFESLKNIFIRIHNLFIVKDLEEFFIIENSLGTRLCITLNDILLSLKYPFGVGYGQIVKHITEILINSSSIPITYEVYEVMLKGGGYGAPGLIFRILCENGYVGAILFLIYLQKHYFYLKRVVTGTKDVVTKCIARGFLGSTVSLIVLLFYDVVYSNMHLWLILGVGTAIVLNERKRLKL